MALQAEASLPAHQTCRLSLSSSASSRRQSRTAGRRDRHRHRHLRFHCLLTAPPKVQQAEAVARSERAELVESERFRFH